MSPRWRPTDVSPADGFYQTSMLIFTSPGVKHGGPYDCRSATRQNASRGQSMVSGPFGSGVWCQPSHHSARRGGTASTDTRMAIASALGITPGELSGSPPRRKSNKTGALGCSFRFPWSGSRRRGCLRRCPERFAKRFRSGLRLGAYRDWGGRLGSDGWVASNRFLRAKPKTV